MRKKQDRDTYKIRTLSYYQQEGGIYNDLITVLTNLRADANIRLRMAPVKVLNEACRICDAVNTSVDVNITKDLNYWWDTLGRAGNIERLVIFSTMYILSTEDSHFNLDLTVELKKRLRDDNIIFPSFIAIPHDQRYLMSEPYIDEVEKQLNDYRKQLEERDCEINRLKREKYDDAALHFEEENNALKKMYSELAMESMQKEIDFKAQIADLEEQCKNKDYEISRLTVKQVVKPKTEVDKVLNFDNIMAYIESRGSYENCIQLFTMLDKLVRRVVTDEQLSQIDALETKMIEMSKGVIFKQDIHGNHGPIMTGTVHMTKDDKHG